ncbi:MAG: hypothetical protein WB870_04425 [Gallionellaceae bacterium]|jgi:hypothetical protein
MNANTKTLLTVCRIASRNGSLPLVRAGKGRRDAPLSPPLYPSNPASRPSGILKPGQKTVTMLRLLTGYLWQDRASTMLY